MNSIIIFIFIASALALTAEAQGQGKGPPCFGPCYRDCTKGQCYVYCPYYPYPFCPYSYCNEGSGPICAVNYPNEPGRKCYREFYSECDLYYHNCYNPGNQFIADSYGPCKRQGPKCKQCKI